MARRFVVLVALCAAVAVPVDASSAGARERATTAAGLGIEPDFDGDGYADLAVGVPFENIGDKAGAGAVNVIYGAAAGLSVAGDQVWSQDGAGVKDVAEPGDSFGASLAPGDFDADGFADLAIGIPGEDVNGLANAGAVAVLYGSSSGVSSSDQIWSMADTFLEPQASDRYGWSLAAGDFDADGFFDLAVGVPGRDGLQGTPVNVGGVHILFGSSEGLRSPPAQFLQQSAFESNDEGEEGDAFGRSLAAGDFNNGGWWDLAVGVPFEDIVTTRGTMVDAGAVHLLFGSDNGLTFANDRFHHQGEGGATTTDPAEAGDRFGWSLAAGDLGGSLGIDIVVGVPFEDHGSVRNSGAIDVIKASSLGGYYYIDQATQDIEGTVEDNDFFGWSVAIGDFGRNPSGDVAVGVPGEGIGSIGQAGALGILYSSESGGVSLIGDQVWSQNTSGVLDGSETADFMGRTVMAADFGHAPYADVAVGVPSEDLGGVEGAGAVAVLYSSSDGIGISATSDQLWSQLGDVEGSAEPRDAFGSSLLGSPYQG